MANSSPTNGRPIPPRRRKTGLLRGTYSWRGRRSSNLSEGQAGDPRSSIAIAILQMERASSWASAARSKGRRRKNQIVVENQAVNVHDARQ